MPAIGLRLRTIGSVSKLRLPLGLAIAIAIFALPSGAIAESIVPPGNSAVTQYTEAIPTAGGEQEAGGRKKGKRTPEKVLGGRKVHRLESKGPQGKAVATFAAETSPAPVTPGQDSGLTRIGSGAKHEARDAGHKGHRAGGGHKSASPGGIAAHGPGPDPNAGEPSGSSGLGEVIGEATGFSSSGQLGLLLPLILIGTVVWSLVFRWLHRRRVA